jgi:hypothetical protein
MTSTVCSPENPDSLRDGKKLNTTYNEHIGSAEDGNFTDLRNLHLFQYTTISLIIQAIPACLQLCIA